MVALELDNETIGNHMSVTHADLLTRLRHPAKSHADQEKTVLLTGAVCADMREAADEIERLRALSPLGEPTESLTYDEEVEMLRLADDIEGGEIADLDTEKCQIISRALRMAAAVRAIGEPTEGTERVIAAARLVIKDYPVAAGTIKQLIPNEPRGYGSIKKLADALTALRASGAGWQAPKGWKLVPEELTEDMAEAIELASGTEQLWADVLAAAPPAMPLQDHVKAQPPKMRPETTPEMLELARRLVLERPSTSYIQRKLMIGYNHACEIMEHFKAIGLVSASREDGKRVILAEDHGEADRV